MTRQNSLQVEKTSEKILPDKVVFGGIIQNILIFRQPVINTGMSEVMDASLIPNGSQQERRNEHNIQPGKSVHQINFPGPCLLADRVDDTVGNLTA